MDKQLVPITYFDANTIKDQRMEEIEQLEMQIKVSSTKLTSMRNKLEVLKILYIKDYIL